jgi:hypothetical protein
MVTNMSAATMLALFSTLAVTSAGCLVSVEVDAPEIEVTQHDVLFDGVPRPATAGDVALVRSYSQAHDKLDLPDDINPEVRALGVSLTAKRGIQDFMFIHNLRVTMSDETHAPVELIAYQQQPGAVPASVLNVDCANPVNTLEAWRTDAATFTIEVAGDLPEQEWAADIAVRFAGKIKYQR